MTNYVEISVNQADQIISTNNPLIIDARDAHSYRDQHIDGAMLSHGGLVEHLINNADLEKPVIVYCYHGNSSKDLAEVLGRAGFKNCYSMKGGYTAWKKRSTLYAENNYSPATTKWLIKNGFEELSLNTTIETNISPLILACRENNEDVALELIAAGADLNHRDGDGNTPLWAACYSEGLALISDLVESGANINSQNSDGVTSLMYSSSAGKTAVVSLLLKHGANKELQNKDDFTAIDLASTKEVLNALKTH